MKALLAKKLVLENEIIEGYGLLIENGSIHSIVEHDAIDAGSVEVMPEIADYLLPGFIDIHIHGSAGSDVMDASSASLTTIQNSLVHTGTTSFLGTTMTMPFEQILAALEQVRTQMQLPTKGSKILGAHLEGPFINPKAKGAHLESYICLPEIQSIEAYKDIIKLITIAPETDPEGQFIENARQLGINISLGHSTCSYDCAKKAIASGANSITHLFNAMTGLHHRDPGLVGAALLSDVYTELIADNVHVHPDLYELVYKLKGPERMILITDAMKGQCMKQGRYDLGGQPVIVGENDARLENGTLAGSILTQDKAFRHMLNTNGVDILKVSRMLSGNPARLIGENQLGSIQKGHCADLVAMNEAMFLTHTFVDGELVYHL